MTAVIGLVGGGSGPASQAGPDPLALAMQRVLAHHGCPRSIRSLLDGLPSTERVTPHLAARALTEAGFSTRVVARQPGALHEGLLPAILLLFWRSIMWWTKM